MAEINSSEIRAALEATKPPPVQHRPPVVATAVVVVCITFLALVANVALWQWGHTKTEELSRLRSEVTEDARVTACRSQLAVNVDITQGGFLFALGELIDVAISDDPATPEERRAQFDAARDRYERMVDQYGDALTARDQTSTTCKPGN